MGVTATQNNRPMTIGDNTFPSSTPKRNQSRFSGVSAQGIPRATITNATAMTSAQVLYCPKYSSGSRPTEPQIGGPESGPGSNRSFGLVFGAVFGAVIQTPTHAQILPLPWAAHLRRFWEQKQPASITGSVVPRTGGSWKQSLSLLAVVQGR
jgi:hypothetical protein